jgi:hypothetical protein
VLKTFCLFFTIGVTPDKTNLVNQITIQLHGKVILDHQGDVTIMLQNMSDVDIEIQ